MDAEVAKWRSEIDEIDRHLVALLELRMTASIAVAFRKAALGLPGHDPARERELVARAHPSVRPTYAEIVRRCREAGSSALSPRTSSRRSRKSARSRRTA